MATTKQQLTVQQKVAQFSERLGAELISLIQDSARELASDTVRAQLAPLMDGLGTAKPSAESSPARRTGGAGQRRVFPCPVPDCKKQGKGPRFHYLCEDHRDMNKRDREKIIKAAREPGGKWYKGKEQPAAANGSKEKVA